MTTTPPATQPATPPAASPSPADLQASFLRPVPGDSAEVQVTARVQRAGKHLVFGEILLHDSAGRLAAHATTTYALL